MKLMIKTEFKTIEIDDIKQGTNPESGNATFHPPKRVKTLAPVNEEEFTKAKEFAETFVTEARLEQGLFVMENEMLLEPEIKNIGAFIKWTVNDVIKEEQNAIVQSDLNPKKVAQEISKLARNWFLRKF